MMPIHINNMAVTTPIVLVACLLALISPLCAEFLCSTDFYGVLEGNAYSLPEQRLPGRDMALAVPPMCRGEFLAGMSARLCTRVWAPSVKVANWGTVLVNLNAGRPTYSRLNMTVYCIPRGPPTPSSMLLQPDPSAVNELDPSMQLLSNPPRGVLPYYKSPKKPGLITDPGYNGMAIDGTDYK